jgi:hypothetical protein
MNVVDQLDTEIKEAFQRLEKHREKGEFVGYRKTVELIWSLVGLKKEIKNN